MNTVGAAGESGAHPSSPAEGDDGLGRFGAAVERFDTRFDAALEPLRDHRALAAVMNAATNAGEFSLIWHAASLARGLVVRRPDQVLALAVGLGAESLVVNQGLKRLFRRRRPTTGGDPRFDIRAPVTSSFPSGHASAAGFAATVLIGWDGRRSAPLWVTAATTVAVSRPFVRIHHGSDIVAGAAVGVAMGIGARRIMRRLGIT